MSADTLEPPRLFPTRTAYLVGAVALLLLCFVTLSFKYSDYLQFKRFDWHTVEALVVAQKSITVHHKKGFMLRLEHPDMTFYTRSFYDLKNLTGHAVSIALYTPTVTFLDFLRGFYVHSALKGAALYPDARFQQIALLHEQHANPLLANLYGALFFVEPIEPALRILLTQLGINHLAALSGFHLGFLALLLTVLARWVYAPLHRRFVPYRPFGRDVMFFILIVLGAYLLFLGSPPSLLRAYAMMAVGFYLFDRGMRILSFETLGVTVLLLLALFPQLFFAMGFWLSVGGVLMLFILLVHYQNVKKWQLFLILNVGVYVLMAPLGVALFEQFNPLQLLSPLLSMGFVLFYPLSIVLHLLGTGSALDGALAWVLTLDAPTMGYRVPQGFLIFYTVSLLLSVRYKGALFVTLTLCGLLLAWLLFQSHFMGI